MYQRRRARVLVAILVLVTLVLVTIDFRSGDDGPLAGIRGFTARMFAPVQEGLAALVRPVGEAAGNVRDIFTLRSENERLTRQLAEAQDRERSFDDLQRRVTELEELLAIRDDYGATVAATAHSFGASNFEFSISLDVGSDDGVRRNMPVVSGDGLVGRVTVVEPNVSQVLLAIDPNFSAAARVSRTGEVGVLTGRAGRPMRFEPLDPEADIRPGDEIVTSPYSNGIFPAGIRIGTVEEEGITSTTLSREVLVRPFVDFTRIDRVLVILHEPIASPDVDDPGTPEFLPPVIPSPAPSPTPTPSATPPEDQGGDA